MEYTVKVEYGNAWKIVAITRDINTAYRIASLWDTQGFVAIVSQQPAMATQGLGECPGLAY